MLLKPALPRVDDYVVLRLPDARCSTPMPLLSAMRRRLLLLMMLLMARVYCYDNGGYYFGEAMVR